MTNRLTSNCARFVILSVCALGGWEALASVEPAVHNPAAHSASAGLGVGLTPATYYKRDRYHRNRYHRNRSHQKYRHRSYSRRNYSNRNYSNRNYSSRNHSNRDYSRRGYSRNCRRVSHWGYWNGYRALVGSRQCTNSRGYVYRVPNSRYLIRYR